jgi:hypothetical protein
MSASILGAGLVFFLREITKPFHKKKQFQLLRLRNPEAISAHTKRILETVTIDSSNTLPVGSWLFRTHKYPGDIDIFEQVRECCDATTAKSAITQKIQKIAAKVRDRQDVFLGDFKAGLDNRFKINIGEIKDGSVFNYDQSEVRKQVIDLFNQGLLSKEKAIEIHQLAIDEHKMNVEAYEDLNNALRKFYVLRWSLDELLAGQKILPGNKTLLLEDAITHKSLVKIDVWTPKYDGNFTEVTNFFLLIAVDKNGKEKTLNLELPNYAKSLIKDIKLYSSPGHLNSLKAAKRLFTYSKLTDDRATMDTLAPLFSADASKLNQIKDEFEVLHMLIEKYPDQVPWNIVVRQIGSIIERIGDVNLDYDEDQMLKLLEQTGQLSAASSKNIPAILTNLKMLEKMTKPSIEKYSNNYLRQVGMWSKIQNM